MVYITPEVISGVNNIQNIITYVSNIYFLNNQFT